MKVVAGGFYAMCCMLNTRPACSFSDRGKTPKRRDIMRSSTPSLHRQSTASQLLFPKIEKLPDASLLLGSSAFSSQQLSNRDHFSRVSVGMTVSATSRKRELSGSVSSFSCNKYPRGTVPTSQNVSDTIDSLLVPPQLSGRSNVVTEDIGKLFVKRGAHRSPP